ncbi:MAG: ZIP family metal transporter [Oscillospiraceae bacterium]
MLYPIFLCALSSLSTGLGGVITALFKKITDRTMSISQGFAAGVMLGISVFDMVPHAYINSLKYLTTGEAAAGIVGLFISGWVIGALLGQLVVPRYRGESQSQFTAKKMMMITTAVVVAHNLPEGMLTVFSAASDRDFGLKMALAIALHNLPEGMAIAAPVLYVTQSRSRAVFQSFMAGFAELFGGLITLILFKNLINESFINGLLPIIAGIMCQTSIMELIPGSAKISNIKHTIYGIIIGIMTMCIGIFII